MTPGESPTCSTFPSTSGISPTDSTRTSIDDFVSAYARGETPNPCVRCNERIKFSALAARALALGFDAVASGHYARLSDGRLRRAVDADKDQSYVLGGADR